MPYTFHLRTLEIAIGVALIAALGIPALRLKAKPLGGFAERHYKALLTALTLGFALAAYAAKLTQLHALKLNSEDFWLFEDMLRQMREGGFFITRFAPQAQGWVQHGIVHPMFTWALALPLTALIDLLSPGQGATQAALLWGPLFFAGAGLMLALITQPRLGATAALAIAAAFLASSQVGRVLMYDVHPESAYPFFTLLWAWAAGWGDGKKRWPALIISTLALTGIKEDSFLVILPLIAATGWRETRNTPAQTRPVHLAPLAALAMGVTALQFAAVKLWASGAWGPHQWQGENVVLPTGAALVKNRHWDTPAHAWEIIQEILAQKGGLIGGATEVIKWIFSRPHLSLLLVAPWVILRPTYWISTVPLMILFGLLDEPGKFINYYSASFLGLFWLAATLLPRQKHAISAAWVLIASLVLGGSSISLYRPTELERSARDEARRLNLCVQNLEPGMVSGPFLGIVDRNSVKTDREPTEAVGFYFFSEQLASYELPSHTAQNLSQRLQNDPSWIQLGNDCRPRQKSDSSLVFLFVKR